MRHRQAAQHRLAGGDVDEHAAVGAAVAPAVGHVGIGDQRDVAWPLALERQPVEVAAVLGRELADERRPPQRLEAVTVAHRGDAREQRIDEHRPPVRRECHVVGVDVAGDPDSVRGKHRVVLPMRAAFGDDIVEAQELVLGRQHERAGVGANAQSHAAREGPLEHGQAAARLEPDQEQLAGLVGREGEARTRARQPFGKMPRRGERELLFRRSGGWRRRGNRGHGMMPLLLAQELESLTA